MKIKKFEQLNESSDITYLLGDSLQKLHDKNKQLNDTIGNLLYEYQMTKRVRSLNVDELNILIEEINKEIQTTQLIQNDLNKEFIYTMCKPSIHNNMIKWKSEDDVQFILSQYKQDFYERFNDMIQLYPNKIKNMKLVNKKIDVLFNSTENLKNKILWDEFIKLLSPVHLIFR